MHRKQRRRRSGRRRAKATPAAKRFGILEWGGGFLALARGRWTGLGSQNRGSTTMQRSPAVAPVERAGAGVNAATGQALEAQACRPPQLRFDEITGAAWGSSRKITGAAWGTGVHSAAADGQGRPARGGAVLLGQRSPGSSSELEGGMEEPRACWGCPTARPGRRQIVLLLWLASGARRSGGRLGLGPGKQVSEEGRVEGRGGIRLWLLWP